MNSYPEFIPAPDPDAEQDSAADDASEQPVDPAAPTVYPQLFSSRD